MSTGVWADLLTEMRAVHQGTPAVAGFCPFPDDLSTTPFPVADHPASHHFLADDLGESPYPTALQAIRAAAPVAHWRQTYKDTDIGADFMDRFGCYCLIGPNAPWTSATMYGFFVYMPAGLWYPWHHHPAEELYLVLAGRGVFLKDGAAPAQLGPGDVAIHASNQPHTLLTEDAPVLCYVLWRNAFETPPVLTPDRPLHVPPDFTQLKDSP